MSNLTTMVSGIDKPVNLTVSKQRTVAGYLIPFSASASFLEHRATIPDTSSHPV
jgi:hypothetical protein